MKQGEEDRQMHRRPRGLKRGLFAISYRCDGKIHQFWADFNVVFKRNFCMKDAVLVEGWQCRGRWTMVAPDIREDVDSQNAAMRQCGRQRP